MTADFEYNAQVIWTTFMVSFILSTFFKIMSCIFTMTCIFIKISWQFFCHILELVAMHKLISYISLTVWFQMDLHAHVSTNSYNLLKYFF